MFWTRVYKQGVKSIHIYTWMNHNCLNLFLLPLLNSYSGFAFFQVLGKLLYVCSKEDLSYTDDGIEAILFTAQGDMRQALNNLQSTAQGFGHVSSENVFKVILHEESSMLNEVYSTSMVLGTVKG